MVFEIIDKYYPEDNDLRRLLLKHSWQVAIKAMSVSKKHPELGLNDELLFAGAMIHDIGVFLTDADGIFCKGKAPYLLHGILGGDLLRKEGFPELARFCERHTGTGLSKEKVNGFCADYDKDLCVAEDCFPQTQEEIIVCYADKFYSKSHPDIEKTPEQCVRSLLKFGEDTANRFQRWHNKFK